MGRYMLDYPDVRILTRTKVMREVIGAKGKFGGNWTWDVSYENGSTNQLLAQTNLTKARQTYAAADAVVNPLTGQIVCRSQYYDAAGNFVPGGTGLDAGCKPQDLFGTNTVDPSTMGWTIGDSWKRYKLRQQVAAATLTGDLGDFRLDAGPISVATGVEYRHEHGNATTDPVSVTTIDCSGVRGCPAGLIGRIGPFRFANFQPFGGEYSVKEGFAELGVPLLKGLPFAQYLNADFAGRVTDYTTSGTVETWKVGLDYQMIPDLRLRGTVSRDIRAPSLLELYNGATFNSQNQFYPSTFNGNTVTVVQITSGNPNLVPERALTQTYGAVLTPTFIDGLSLSADYYNIKIDNAIQTVGSQQTLDNCYLNIPGYCDLIQVVGGVPRIRTPFLNVALVKVAGLDLAANYKTEFLGNPMTLSVQAQDLLDAYTLPASTTLQLGGEGDPKWRANASINYDVSDWSFFLQERYIGPKKTDASRVEGVYVDQNSVPHIFYTDLTITYSMDAFGSHDQLYLSINNLTNQNPPLDVGAPSSFAQPGNRSVYDPIGRYFNLGIRFKL
jgi:outer membrane receptor protein involved in Fe transport